MGACGPTSCTICSRLLVLLTQAPPRRTRHHHQHHGKRALVVRHREELGACNLRGALCVVTTLWKEWLVTVTKTVATYVLSCHHHEQGRRPLRRRGASCAAACSVKDSQWLLSVLAVLFLIPFSLWPQPLSYAVIVSSPSPVVDPSDNSGLESHRTANSQPNKNGNNTHRNS